MISGRSCESARMEMVGPIQSTSKTARGRGPSPHATRSWAVPGKYVFKALGSSVGSRGALRDCVIMIYLNPILAAEPADQPRVQVGMGDDERITFGANVKAARRALSLTQAELAEKVGIKQGYLSRIEGGKADMTFEVMTRVAKALGSDVHKMLSP